MNKNSEKKFAAFEYRDNGWNIFPVTAGEKRPLTAALKSGSQNSVLENPLTEDDIEAIWTEYPDANIAAHTGPTSQIAVIDIDVAKNDDEVKAGKRTKEQATTLAKQLIAIFGETRVHRSPSGGYHLIYRYTPLCDGVGRKIDAFKKVANKHSITLVEDSSPVDLANVDILAGDGYILIPPSVIDGNSYELLHELDGPELQDFPEELIRLLNRRDKTSRAYFDLRDGTANAIPEHNGKEQKIIKLWEANGKKKLLQKLQQYMGAGAGTRHDTLLKVCGTVFATLPYKEWNTANSYVDMVIATFTPPYMKGSSVEIEADKREIRNAFEYAKANEYADRMLSNKKEEENFADRVERDIEIIKELGEEVNEDEYKEAVAKVFEAFQTNEKGEPIPNDYNVGIILEQHPKYRNRVRYDTFTEHLTYHCRIGRRYEEHPLRDKKDNPAMAQLLQDIQVDFFPRVPRSSVYSAAVLVGHNQDYDSYRDDLDKLKGKWDGVERMQFWLQRVFDVPDDVYHRGLSAQFIFAMVRRGYEPGAEFSKVLFLSGSQGVGKSYSMRILAGSSDRFLEFSDSLEGREIHLHAKGKTLIDLSEGESMQRSSIKRVKALITDASGTHRTFGGEEVDQHPVRFVIAITNNDSPLVDNSGNRRFLPVDIALAENQVGDVGWLEANRAQIFAEAVHKYHEMVKLREQLEDEIAEAKEAADATLTEKLIEKRRIVTSYECKLSDFDLPSLTELQPEQMETFVTPYQVALIPQEIAHANQSDKRMHSPLEYEIQAVFLSYDEYRAGHKDFFITTEEVVEQLSGEAVRQSRLGGFLNSEVGRLLRIIDTRLESVRKRYGTYGQRRGVKFIHPFPDAPARLQAIKRLRQRAAELHPVPPSTFGGGSKAVTLEEKAARIRWEREGDAFLVLSELDIQMELTEPESVEVAELLKQDKF